jgi:hypothetical protein
MPINILILAAGGTASDTDLDEYPLCLTEVGGGVSVLERIVLNTSNFIGAKYAFAILSKDADNYHLDKVANILVPGAKVVRVPENTKGSACTALLAAANLDQDAELLIISANEIVDVDLQPVIEDFRGRLLDAGTLSFKSVHPRYSYVRLSHEGYVVEAAQRNPISNHATAGIFWFRNTSDFVAATMDSIRKDTRVLDKFFVAPTFNQLILKHQKIGVWNIDIDLYHPLKTEKQLQNFEHGSSL